jgi:hypothetical protein
MRKERKQPHWTKSLATKLEVPYHPNLLHKIIPPYTETKDKRISFILPLVR